MDEAPVSSRPVNQARNRRENGERFMTGSTEGSQVAARDTRAPVSNRSHERGVEPQHSCGGLAEQTGPRLTCSGLIPALVLRLLLHQLAAPWLHPIIPARVELT